VVNVIWRKSTSIPLHSVYQNMDGSIVFARWRQCAPYVTHAYLGPPESKSQTAPRSVQPLLHSSQQTVPILHNGALPPNIAHSYGDLDLVPTLFLGPTRVQDTNGISIGSVVFARFMAERPFRLQWAAPFPKIAPSCGGNLDPHLIHETLGLTESSIQTASRSVGATFAGLTTVTDRQTTLLGW